MTEPSNFDGYYEPESNHYTFTRRMESNRTIRGPPISLEDVCGISPASDFPNIESIDTAPVGVSEYVVSVVSAVAPGSPVLQSQQSETGRRIEEEDDQGVCILVFRESS